MHVDVFQVHAIFELSAFDLLTDLAQTGFDLADFIGAQNANMLQHPSVRDRSFNVMRVKPLVKADAFSKLLDPTIGGLIKYAAS